MAQEINWSGPARNQLREILEHIHNDSPQAALKVQKDIFHSVELLGVFQYRGKAVPKFDKQGVREIVSGKYRIFYSATVQEIRILAMFHGTRKISWLWLKAGLKMISRKMKK